jgi:hypothetical protein
VHVYKTLQSVINQLRIELFRDIKCNAVNWSYTGNNKDLKISARLTLSRRISMFASQLLYNAIQFNAIQYFFIATLKVNPIAL